MKLVKKMMWLQVGEKDFDNLPETDAVYIIVAHTTRKHYIAIYTGQTNDIKRRSKEHWSEDETNEKLKNVIANCKDAISLFYALDNENSLDGHEKFLYEHYEPQTQSKAPDVEPRPISLPENVVNEIIINDYFAS